MMSEWSWVPERQRWELGKKMPGVEVRLVVEGDPDEVISDDMRSLKGVWLWRVMELDGDEGWLEAARGFRQTPRAGMVAAERESELSFWYAAVV